MLDEAAGQLPSDDQLNGTACIDCGNDEEQLYRGETITTHPRPGVAKDSTVVRCTPCLKARKSKALRVARPAAVR